MKKLILTFLLSITIISCSEEFLETPNPNQLAAGIFWQSEADAFLALNGIYANLQSSALYRGALNGWQGIPAYDCLGDNGFNQYTWEGPGTFMEGNYNTANRQFNAIWFDSYRGIARANDMIFNVEKADESLINEQTKNELNGQARFLRGLMYFNLAVYFEDVPLVLRPLTLEESYVPKNTYAEVTQAIVDDLIFASENLPVSHPDNLFGYATKGAALSLLARVQLYNKVYTGQYGVLNLTQEVMGLGYGLFPNYASLFTSSQESETSNEIVFSVRFQRGNNTRSGEMFSASFASSPKIDVRPMPNLVDAYYCTDGLPITSSPLYNPNNKKLNRDPRALATIYFAGDQWLDNPVRIFATANSPTGFGLRKYLRRGPDAEGNGIGSEGSQDFYVIRYADVLLMRAEAMAETGDLSGARQMVNLVRARVNMPSVESVEGTSLNQNQTIQLVRQERRVELAFESLRFMDLKRWNQIQQGFQRAASDPINGYNPVYTGPRSHVFPIPQVEIDVNKNLVQHPAWQ